MSLEQIPDFHTLTPEVILPLVEEAADKKLTPLCRSYTSYINRVYELQFEDGESIIAKFYRPGRWKKEAVLEEHLFLRELHEAEIPVIAPTLLSNNSTLGTYENNFFALFPKKGGRNCDELTEEAWLEIGRLMGRTHLIGEKKEALHRVCMRPSIMTENQVQFILNGQFIPTHLEKKYQNVTDQLIQLIDPLFNDIASIRIHGDCHYANILYRPGESFYLIDFDDMVMGPSVQDFWMLLPNYRNQSQREINLFIEGYETFRSFRYKELQLIEALRAMRYIHFTSWCARQVADGGFSRISPQWGEIHFWQEEIRDIETQIKRIESELEHFKNN